MDMRTLSLFLAITMAFGLLNVVQAQSPAETLLSALPSCAVGQP